MLKNKAINNAYINVFSSVIFVKMVFRTVKCKLAYNNYHIIWHASVSWLSTVLVKSTFH